MDLIIKIPDEVYKTVQDGSYCGSLYEELKAARPYEPSEDLISRSDALKAVDARHEELLHDAEYRRKHCDIDLLGIKKHILAIPPANVFKLTKGDLISREVLKEEIASYEREFAPDWVLNLINNAPSVEVFTLEDMQNNFDLGAMSEAGKHDRPQGEWVETTFETDDEEETEVKAFVCSRCGASRVAGLGNAKFCYKCGAQMYEEGEEE